MTEAKLPNLGEGIEKASVSYWHKSIGDSVKEGEDLVELVTPTSILFFQTRMSTMRESLLPYVALMAAFRDRCGNKKG